MNLKLSLLCMVAFFALERLVHGHITLTFPPARYPPIDFLDTARTIGPCGLPKTDRSIYSTMQTITPYNITWRLQYPHQGGYRLYLLDYMGNVVENLAPDKPVIDDATQSNNFDGLDEQSAEWRQIEFHTSCKNCSLVLERQALEWGPSYKFRSCAEVHIIDEVAEKEMCFNGGQWKNNVCVCQKRTSGKLCQYKDDCDSDVDCLNNGKCLANSIFPNKKSCFCAYGYYGPTCKEVSNAAFTEDECFRHLGNNTFFPTLKYGIFDPKCFKQFDLGNGDLLYSRIIKDQMEMIMDYETESYVAVGWRPYHISRTCRLFPDLSRDKADARQGGKTSGYLQSALEADLHPMDCTDIVMASVVDNNHLHIEDMYTRDRSTPLIDDLLDGEQSLTAAYGVQRNGRTIVMFRRGIREIEPSDHPLGPGKLFVIHAKGQAQGSYKHVAPSALEKRQTSKTDFYKNDQWRYHGSSNRGVQMLEFVSAMEMRFASPIAHLEGSSSAVSPKKVLERPSLIKFREQVLPRPDEPLSNKDSSSTSIASTLLTLSQNSTVESTSEKTLTVPEPEPGPRITLLYKSHKNQPENISQEEPLNASLSSSGTLSITPARSTVLFALSFLTPNVMLRFCQTLL